MRVSCITKGLAHKYFPVFLPLHNCDTLVESASIRTELVEDGKFVADRVWKNIAGHCG